MSAGSVSEEKALIGSVIATPEDDAPRLVYADWLEEHGRAERAELIRVQCELSRLRHGSPEYLQRGEKLEAREAELLQAHRDEWAAELQLPPNRHTSCWFKRGMVGEVWCSVRYFREHGATILAAAPVEVVCLRRTTPRNLAGLASHPDFPRVRGVRFLMGETPADTVSHFLQTVPVEHLQTLTLTTSFTTARGGQGRNVALATAIARCPGLLGLRRLRLRHAEVGDAGALALAGSPFLAGLELLDLRNNVLSTTAEAALRAAFGERLCLQRRDQDRFTVGEFD
jgi:uncharacterized protein (TIGR02996 family)